MSCWVSLFCLFTGFVISSSCFLFSAHFFISVSSHSLYISVYSFSFNFLLFDAGWVFSLLKCLSLFLSFLNFLIFVSSSSSFSLSLSNSCSYFLYSWSPILVLRRGMAHLLYSDFEFSKKCLLLAWIMTDSRIWRSNDVFVNSMTFMPNFTSFLSSVSCLSSMCFRS